MRVFITGATGWIGSATVGELLANGHEVIGLARREESARGLEAQGATPLRGDLDDLDSLRRGVARADFDALCGRALGPADYLALATHIHTLVLDGVPRLGPENADKARRFITLVDALYEHRCKLIASAEAPPDRIYERGESAAMFERTASRLMEMQSQEYLSLPHLT